MRCLPSHFSSAAPSAVALEIYETGRAVVREERTLALSAGDNQVSLAGMPTSLLPASVIVLGSEGDCNITVGDLT